MADFKIVNKTPLRPLGYFGSPVEAYPCPETAGSEVVVDSHGLPLPPLDLMQYGESHERHIAGGQRDAGFLIENVLPLVEKKSSVQILELGCANGRVMRWLHPYVQSENWDIFGCDINSRTAFWAMRSICPPFHIFVNTMQPHLPFADESLDCVYAMSVFTHMDSLAPAWLYEIARVTKAGGIVFVTILDGAAIRNSEAQPNRPIRRLIEDAGRRLDRLGPECPVVAVNNAGYGGQIFFDRDFFTRQSPPSLSLEAEFENVMGIQSGLLFRKLR